MMVKDKRLDFRVIGRGWPRKSQLLLLHAGQLEGNTQTHLSITSRHYSTHASVTQTIIREVPGGEPLGHVPLPLTAAVPKHWWRRPSAFSLPAVRSQSTLRRQVSCLLYAQFIEKSDTEANGPKLWLTKPNAGLCRGDFGNAVLCRSRYFFLVVCSYPTGMRKVIYCLPTRGRKSDAIKSQHINGEKQWMSSNYSESRHRKGNKWEKKEPTCSLKSQLRWPLVQQG